MKRTERVVVSMTPDTVKISLDEMPKHEQDTLCRVILDCTKRAFANPQFAAEYEQWLADRKARGIT